jgi:hypothetical protein
LNEHTERGITYTHRFNVHTIYSGTQRHHNEHYIQREKTAINALKGHMGNKKMFKELVGRYYEKITSTEVKMMLEMDIPGLRYNIYSSVISNVLSGWY